MKPDDDNGNLPPSERPFHVLLISGSQRRQYNCAEHGAATPHSFGGIRARTLATGASMTTDEVYQSYLAAVRYGERHRAFELIDRARAADMDLRTLYLEVFQPTLREVGRLWQENLLTVAEEHLATGITQAAMLRLYSHAELPLLGTGPSLIAACAETERHEIGLRMLCDFLDLEGWDTTFLGATMPAESLVQMVRERKPDAVALSCTIAPHLPQLRATIAAIRKAAGGTQPLILVGGRPFLDRPQRVQSVGADLTASDASEAARLLGERFR